MGIIAINERTSDSREVASIREAWELAKEGFTRIEEENAKGAWNFIYRRKEDGQMVWLDEDESLYPWTFDDGKGELTVAGEVMPSINAAIKWANTNKESQQLPDTIWIAYDRAPEVRLRWFARKRKYVAR